MADDITLTVRVRDMTRGEFAQIRQRMRGMDGDIRRVAQASGNASQSADRFGRSLQGVQGRLGQLQHTGRLATGEMDHMRRSMRLMARDLSMAMRAGDLTEDQFRSLRDELERTRLDFDHLDSGIRRHDAVAQAAHRRELARQRAAATAARQAAAEQRRIAAEQRRIANAAAAAQRRAEADLRRAAAAQAAAARRAQAEQRRAAAAAAADLRRQTSRLAAPTGDQGITQRFRALGDDDANRMSRAFSRLTGSLNGVTGSSARTRRNVSALGDDLRTMSQILQNAQRDGNLARREFNALSNGLHLASSSARDLRRSGDLSRAGFRSMHREIERLRAQMRLLGDEGTRLTRLNDRLQLLQRRLGDVDSSAGRTRRTLARVGEGGLGGLRGIVRGLSLLGAGFSNLRERISGASRGVKMFLLVIALIGPLAAPIGALLTTVLGGAFVALGAFALRGEKDVRSAFTRMKATIGSTVREAAQPMRGALVQGINQTGAAFEDMGKQLTAAFAATAPLVKNVMGAITDFAARALPGLTQSLQDMGPVIEGFRDAMGTIGEGIGQMFASMTSGGGANGLSDAWKTMGKEIKILLVNMGEFISSMSRSATATGLLIGMFRTLSGILIVIEGAFKAVDVTLVPLLKKLYDLGNALSFGDSPTGLESLGKLFDALGISGSDAKGHLVRLRGAVDESAAAFKRNAAAIKESLDKLKELNELNRASLDARAAQQQAILDAKKGYTEFSTALSMTNGQLNLNSQASLDAYKLLSDIATQTNAATTAAQESKKPWAEVHSLWKTGHDNLVTFADGMGLTTEQARILADQIVKMPDANISFKARTNEAMANLDSVIAAFKAAPGEKVITVKTLSQDAISLLRTIGFEVTQLPDGQFEITAKTADAKRNIGLVQAARDGLKGKSIAITIPTDPAVLATYTIQAAINAMTGRTLGVGVYTTEYYKKVEQGGNAIGASTSIPGITKNAKGGLLSFFADGGMKENHVAQIAPRGSWRVWAEDEAGDEAYIPLASNKRPRSRQIASETVDRLGGSVQWFAKGGSTKSKATTSAAAKAQRDAQGDLRGQMGLSRFGIMAGFGTTSMEKGLARPGGMDTLVNTLNSLNGTIKKAFSGSKESGLLKQLDRSAKALITYQKKLEAVNKRLDAAKDKLNGLRQEANSLRESVKSGVMSATNITSGVSGDKSLTMADLMTKMTQNRDKATAFSGALDGLRKKGVSKDIIQQISEAGISGGGLETAGALLSASSSEIASINQLQGQINKAAKAAGDSAAGAMYSAGIKAAEGLVKGLTKQKKSIEKAMMDIAKSMEKAIKRALGIKSPSKVMQEVGHFTAEGFSVGMRKNTSPDAAWASMLTAPSAASGTGGGGSYGGGGGTYVFPIYLGDKKIDEVVLDSNRRTVRTHGGNVQSTYGRKNG